MIEVKYFEWLSTNGEKECYKNGALFSGMVRDCPENLKEFLDKSDSRSYISIYSKTN